MAVQFGTDGIRGRAGVDITDDLAYRLGVAVASVFSDHPCFVGYDTRASSPEFAAAVCAGVRSGGAQAVNLGVFTTPGVAIIAEQRGGTGVVISASHNPFHDNGLKVLGVGGSKLDLATEAAVQAALDAAPSAQGPFEATPIDGTAAEEYLARLRSTLPEGALHGLHVILDCANGAASALAPKLFRSMGAHVDVIHDAPDGTNINLECGSTHPGDLVDHVRNVHADLGLAFDGDADRLIAVDAHGMVRDGDDLMILFARDLDRRDELGGAVVVSTLSNLGLHRSMREAQIGVIETDVGDRHVMLALESHDLSFGGEQSGHLIFRRILPTGDGMLSGLLLCDLVRREGRLSAQADAAWMRMPQRLVNIAVEDYDEMITQATLREVVERHHIASESYRLLIRPSGTEPVVRVMIEAPAREFVDEFCDLVVERCTPAR